MAERTLMLLIQNDADVAQGAAILRGELPVPTGTTTLQFAYNRDEYERRQFGGAFSGDSPFRGKAEEEIGDKGNIAVTDILAGAIRVSKVQLHVRFMFCNLTPAAQSLLASALLKNATLTGFTCMGNWGLFSSSSSIFTKMRDNNDVFGGKSAFGGVMSSRDAHGSGRISNEPTSQEKEAAESALKDAAIRTRAPLVILNNEPLTKEIRDAREAHARIASRVAAPTSNAKSYLVNIMRRVIEKAGVDPSRSTSIVQILIDDDVDLALLVTLDLAALKAMGIAMGDADKILRSAKSVIVSELTKTKDQIETLDLLVMELGQTESRMKTECQTRQTELDRDKKHIDELQATWTRNIARLREEERVLGVTQQNKLEKTAELGNLKQSLSSLETAFVKSQLASPPAKAHITDDRDFEKAVHQ